jgi:hypothetical protein
VFAVYQDNDPSRDMTPADIVAAIRRIETTEGLVIPGGFHVLNHWRG